MADETTGATPETTPATTEVEAPRRQCMCGCGETPKGRKARFIPGHDARLKGRLIDKYRAATTDEQREAIIDVVERHLGAKWVDMITAEPKSVKGAFNAEAFSELQAI